MATLAQNYLTIADNLKRTDPDNQIAVIIELLAETNQSMMDLVTMEGNLPTGHRTTIRTGLPQGTWRKLYQGVQPTKSTTAQVDDTCGMLEAYSEVDKALADLNGNTGAFRLSESMAFIEGMGQQFNDTLFYGSTAANPERFMGLAPRYNMLSTDSTESGSNIVDAGGSGANNTSMWVVTWGESATCCIYPKGSVAGLQREDKGQVTIQNADGSRWEAYQEHFCHKVGLTVKDWRQNVRIANIDTPALLAGTVNLEELLIDAYGLLKKPIAFDENRIERSVIYCNATTWTALNKRAMNKNNALLSIDTWAGQPILNFWGLPVRRVDSLLQTEALVA